MSKVSVFEQGWIDLVFEGRNKAYGAYQLRRDDGKTTIKAFFSGLGLIAVLVAIPAVMNSFKPAPVNDLPDIIRPMDVGTIHEVKLPEKTIDLPKAEDPAPAPKNPNKTVKLVQPVATSDPVNEPIPDTKQVQTTEISNVTSEGTGKNEINIGVTSPDGKEGGTGKGPVDTGGSTGIENPSTVDIMPEYPGGIDNFRRAVGSKFRTPEINKVVQVTVYVVFIIEPDGSMTNIKTGRDPGYNIAAEAERVLKSMRTKWKPGIKNGKAVRTAYSLPITVNIR